jgi:hypothetical protein
MSKKASNEPIAFLAKGKVHNGKLTIQFVGKWVSYGKENGKELRNFSKKDLKRIQASISSPETIEIVQG